MIPDWSIYMNFTEDEFRCKCGCRVADMSPEFMDNLQSLRDAFASPIIITSGYRCPRHNERVSNTGRDGPHTTGRAADSSIRGSAAVRLLRVALVLPFTGYGISQRGTARFIHLDTMDGPGYPHPRIWSY